MRITNNVIVIYFFEVRRINRGLVHLNAVVIFFFFYFQVLRIQSPEGTKRIEIDQTESTKSLYEKVHDVFNLTGYKFGLYKERGQKGELVSSRSRTLTTCGLRHGDMIYMSPVNGALLWSNDPGTSSSLPPGEPSQSTVSTNSASSSGLFGWKKLFLKMEGWLLTGIKTFISSFYWL